MRQEKTVKNALSELSNSTDIIQGLVGPRKSTKEICLYPGKSEERFNSCKAW